MILSPEEYPQSSVYDLLVAAERGYVGIDHRLLHAIVDRGEAAVPDVVRYALDDRPDDREDLSNDLVSIIRHLRDPRAVPCLVKFAGEWMDDIPSNLILAFREMGAHAVGALLELYQQAGDDLENDLAYLLANLGVRDQHILEALIERMEYDVTDGAACLGAYGDPAALPALDAAAAEATEDWVREAVADAVRQIQSPEPHEEEPVDLWTEYPAEAEPRFDLLDGEDACAFLSSPVPEYRFAAVTVLCDPDLPKDLWDRVFEMARTDTEALVCGRAWQALSAAWSRDDIRSALRAKLADENTPDRERAGALSAIAINEGDTALVRSQIMAFYQKPETRALAMGAMIDTRDSRYTDYFPRHLDDPDAVIVKQAVQGIGFFQIEGAASRLVPFFEDEDLREDALFSYVVSAPVPPTRRGMRQLIEKVERLARGLSLEEELMIKSTINDLLEESALEPLFSKDGAILDIERAVSEKVGRNDPCPCGSGKKYKKCCGA